MDLRAKLITRVNGRIDRSFQPELYRRDLTQELIQGDLSSYHEVDIAFSVLISPRKRAINEGELYTWRKWRKGVLKYMEHAGSFSKQGMQLRKDRVSRVSPVEDLVLARFSKDEACSSQRRELSLDGSNTSVDVPSELSNEEGSVWWSARRFLNQLL